MTFFKHKVVKEYEETTDITCDRCQNTCKAQEGVGQGTNSDYSYSSIITNWNFWTTRTDLNKEFHLCEECYDFMVKTFITTKID